MRWMSVVGLALALAVRHAQADPVQVAALPENTKWVIHLDVDAAKRTPLADWVNAQFLQPQRAEIQLKLNAFQRVTGMQFPDQCHDVTLYGAAYDETSVCILIHGALDREKTRDFLKTLPEFEATQHNDHEVLQWRDKGQDRVLFGAFARDGLAVVSPSQKTVAQALDVLDGKSAALRPGSALFPAPPANGAPAVLYIAADDLPGLTRGQQALSPVLARINSAQLAISTANREVTARAALTTSTDETALQIVQVVEGIKAQMALMAPSASRPAGTFMADLFQGLAVKADGKTVSGTWTVGIDTLESVTKMTQPGAATGRAIPPPAVPPLAQPGR